MKLSDKTKGILMYVFVLLFIIVEVSLIISDKGGYENIERFVYAEIILTLVIGALLYQIYSKIYPKKDNTINYKKIILGIIFFSIFSLCLFYSLKSSGIVNYLKYTKYTIGAIVTYMIFKLIYLKRRKKK